MNSVKFMLAAVVCTGFLSVGCKHSSATQNHDGHMHSADCQCGKECTSCKVDSSSSGEKKCGCGAAAEATK